MMRTRNVVRAAAVVGFVAMLVALFVVTLQRILYVPDGYISVVPLEERLPSAVFFALVPVVSLAVCVPPTLRTWSRLTRDEDGGGAA